MFHRNVIFTSCLANATFHLRFFSEFAASLSKFDIGFRVCPISNTAMSGTLATHSPFDTTFPPSTSNRIELPQAEKTKWLERIHALRSRIPNPPEQVYRTLLSFSNNFILEQNPHLVLIWNRYYPAFGILHDICKEAGIATAGVELSPYSNTIWIDENGSNCETGLAAGFQNSTCSLDNGRRALIDLDSLLINRHSGSNWRSSYTISNAPKKTILVLGCSDAECGIFPRSHPESTAISPFFAHSVELAETIASAGNWNVIFKEHPGSGEIATLKKQPNLVVSNEDPLDLIANADLVVTLAGKLEFITLSMGRPLLLAGKGLLHGTGIAYELASKNQLKHQIETALQHPLRNEQSEQFIRLIGYFAQNHVLDVNEIPHPQNLSTFATIPTWSAKIAAMIN